MSALPDDPTGPSSTGSNSDATEEADALRAPGESQHDAAARGCPASRPGVPVGQPATMSKRPTVAVPRGAMSTDQPDVTQRPGYGDATRCRPSWSDRGAVGEAGAIVGVATAVPIEAAARTAMTPDFSEVLMAYG